MINKLYDVKIDFEKPVQIPVMRFVQHDSKSSGFKLSFEGITDLDVGHKLQIVFVGDYFEPIYDLATITSGSTADYLLKSDVLSKEGCFKALVSLLGASDERLTSTVSLTFEVIPSPDPDLLPIANDDRLPVLTELISSVNQLDKLLKANDSLRASAEGSRVLAETNRNTAENQRISNEVYRQASEDDRQAEFDEFKVQFNALTTEQTSNAEVILARTDSEGVQHNSLKSHLDTWESKVTDLADKLDKEQSKPIVVTDITTVDDAYGGVVDFCVKGGTLNQSVVNGNFADGTTGWTVLNNTMSVSDGIMELTVTNPTNYANSVLQQNYKHKINRKYVAIALVNPKFQNQIALYQAGQYVKVINTPVINRFNLVTATYTATSENTLGFIGHATSSGYTIGDKWYCSKFIRIDITDTFMENWTADQINDYINGYWEGLGGVKNPSVSSHGDNWFDGELELGKYNFAEGNKVASAVDVRSKNKTLVKPNTSYILKSTASGAIAVFEYDKFGKFISSQVFNQVAFTTSINTKYIEYFGAIATIPPSANIMLNEGTTALPYTPYDGSKLSTSGIELFGLPNGVSDEFSQINGENRVIARTNVFRDKMPYFLKSADIIAFSTNLSNIDWCVIGKPLDMIIHGDMSGKSLITSVSTPSNGQGTIDNSNNVWKHYVNPSNLVITLPKGLYVDINALRTDLVTNKKTELIYQIASPVIINEKDYDKHGISISGDALITTKKGYNTFKVSSQNFNPVVDIKYDLNIFTAVDSIKDVLSETRKLVSFLLDVQDQQDAILLDYGNRLSLLEGA